MVFPSSVQWMSVEFDQKCATAQVEDVLQLFIKSPKRNDRISSQGQQIPDQQHHNQSQHMTVTDLKDEKFIPVLQRLHGTENWPKQAVILPGNEILFSLETASDYVKDEKVQK